MISRLRAWLCLNLLALSLQSTVFPDPSIEEPTSFNNTSNISGPPVSFSEDLQGPMASLPCVEGFSSVAHPPESSSIAKSFSKGKRSPSPVTPPSTKRIALSKSFVESPTTIGVKSLSSQGIRSKKKSFQGLKQKGGCSHTKMLKFDLNPDFFWSSFKNTHDCLFC